MNPFKSKDLVLVHEIWLFAITQTGTLNIGLPGAVLYRLPGVSYTTSINHFKLISRPMKQKAG